MTEQSQQARQLAEAETKRLGAERDALLAEQKEVHSLVGRLRGRGRRTVVQRVADKAEAAGLASVGAEVEARLAEIDGEINVAAGQIQLADRADSYSAKVEQQATAVAAYDALVCEVLATLKLAGELAAKLGDDALVLARERDQLAAEREELARRGLGDLPVPETHAGHRSVEDGNLGYWRVGDELAQVWRGQRGNPQ